MSKRYMSMTAAMAPSLRALHGPNAAKKIARRFGIAVRTAKEWLSGRVPAARRAEIALVMLAECDRLEREVIPVIRKQCWEALGDTEDGVVASGGVRIGAAARGVGDAAAGIRRRGKAAGAAASC